MSEHIECEVIVIGGGPAGSTAAAVLADHGRDVVVLEKEQFPRYHIGESMLPYCYFTLQRIGMLETMQKSHFVKKYSVQFARADGRISVPFYFTQHMDHPAAQTWQVVRGEFDQMLLENAARKGASIRQRTTVRETISEGDRVVGVRAAGPEGEALTFRAPMTIDATGRDAFSIARRGWRVRDPQLNKIALWTYFRGALRDPGLDEGATTVAYLPEKGWFWYIPLHDDVVSVGIVAEREYIFRGTTDPAEIMAREIELNEWIKTRVAPGRQEGPYRQTGDFSYRSRHCAADGLVLAGDAFAFLDPVFSSGVFLALRGGELAADAVEAALRAGDVSAARFAEYGETMIQGIEAMRRLVYAFYDQTFSFRKLFTKYPDLKGDLTDCLIGNLFIDFDPLFKAVAEFAEVPAPLAHGGPLAAVS